MAFSGDGVAAVLRTEGLTAGYFGTPAVRDIDIVVRPGETVAVLGPNGAGKTTTLSAIAGLITPLSGQVELDGRSTAGDAAHRLARAGVSLVPENRSLFFGLTARENLRVGRRRGGMLESEVLEILPELQKLMNRKAGVLSGGEQQMLALGRAIGSRPRLLMVDEMSLGLAPVIVERLLPVLRQMAESHGMGVLFVEQHVALALEVADRAYVLNRGQIALEANAERLRLEPHLIESSYLGESSDSSATPA